MNTRIINSFLDTDQYKFTMQQVVFHQFLDVEVKYEFKLRNYPKGTLLPYKKQIEDEIGHLCTLIPNRSELAYLRSIDYFSKEYVDFLKGFHFNKDLIHVYEDDGELRITIEGNWLNTILFETPVLAIVSEIFSRNTLSCFELHDRLEDKIAQLMLYPIKFCDFGTRRRYSGMWHNVLIYLLKTHLPQTTFIGTSNVSLARKYKLTPIGTMAHEYIQAMQALVRLKDSQKYAFQKWADEYRGQLGIALSDTLGMDAFLRDFDLYFAKLFDGARHDSGDPYEWCNKLIKHYEDFGIDPKTKTAVFSDGLTIGKAYALHNIFNSTINCSFGIGTHLTNDTGGKAPQIVIKMVECDGQPVAKISDSKGKQMCNDDQYLRYLASVFNIKEVI